MIEPTDEMVQLALDVFLATPTETIGQIDAGMAKALGAVLSLVERDQAAAVAASRWRCNWTERCFREDGHGGLHAYAGAAPL